MPIIQSLLDNDLYKFTMQQAVSELYPDAYVKYKFTNRRKTEFNDKFLDAFRDNLEGMKELTASAEQLKWLGGKAPFLKPHYLGSLASYRFDPSQVTAHLDADRQLQLSIEGPWHSTILWEVPLMALISELYFTYCDTTWATGDWEAAQRAKAKDKTERLFVNGAYWTDFGTRRRRNFRTQQIVNEVMHQYNQFLGTSNVHLACQFDIKAIGTMAHELIMGISALEGLRHANRTALYKWNEVYKGDLGIALTDTYTTDVFFNEFDTTLAKVYDGVRHDSGDPFKFIAKAEKFYRSKRIDPMSKSCVFSDSLDVDLVLRLIEASKDRIRPLFGIGTHFTNDFPGSPALNMVIKLSFVNGIPVVKLSDDPGKAQGERDAVRVAKWTFLGTPLDT